MATASVCPSQPESQSRPHKRSVVLVGNPNVGKSVLFGLLTRRYVVVSNYPGTTVEITEGEASLEGERVRVVDTPGTNSLLPMSEDERVTRDILLQSPSDVVIQIADMKNVRRALGLSLQLAELDRPFMLVLNMGDEARTRGVSVDRQRLSSRLGVEVVETVATRRQGVAKLQKCLQLARRAEFRVLYERPIEQAAAAIVSLLPEAVASRGLALMLLGGDDTLEARLSEWLAPEAQGELRSIVLRAASRLGREPSKAIAETRQAAVDTLVSETVRRDPPLSSSWAERLGLVAMHPVWGVPVLAAVLYAMYEFVGVLGAGVAVDFLENTVFGRYLAPGSIRLSDALLPFPHAHAVEDGVTAASYRLLAELGPMQHVFRLLHDLLVGEYGVVTMALSYSVAIVLPIVGTFFVAFGLLEDSGYLPRLAIVVNRLFKRIGLNGKAVLPMVLGLGCDTMATLTSRILETRKERLIVIILLSLAVPCSAQLGVILAMLGPAGALSAALWVAVVLAVIALVGWLAARVLPGEDASLVLEIPPLRLPRLKNIVIKTLARIEWYLKEAVPLFVLGTLILFAASELQLLELIRDAAAPVVVHFLDLPREATDAFVIGFLRRDFGAAGLFKLQLEGALDPVQTLVSLVAITLFVPCVAQFLVTIKETGLKTALAVAAFVFPFAILVAGSVNALVRALGVEL